MDPDLAPAPGAEPADPGLRGELLLAVLGIRDFLAREPSRVLVGDHDRARALPGAMGRELRAFLAGEGASAAPGAKPFDYLRVIKQLAQPVQPQDLEQLVGAHRSGEDALDLMVPMTRALAYLNGAAPRRMRTTLVSSDPLPPSDQQLSTFERLFDAVDDPMTLLRRLRAGTLLADEVTAVATVYPVLYGELQSRTGDALAATMVRRPRFRPDARQERLLRTLIGAGPQDSGLVRDMQAAFAQNAQAAQDQGPPPRRKRPEMGADAFATTGQRAESGRGK